MGAVILEFIFSVVLCRTTQCMMTSPPPLPPPNKRKNYHNTYINTREREAAASHAPPSKNTLSPRHSWAGEGKKNIVHLI